MLLWLVFAVLSAGVLAALLRPLIGGAGAGTSAESGTSAVYRDQLTEVEAEAERGLMPAAEAEAARREIARRLIASAAEQPLPSSTQIATEAAATQARRARAIAMALALVIPIASVAGYLRAGDPGLPAQPFAQRRQAPPIEPEMARMIAAVEARLKQEPTDGRGWDVIAPAYLRLGRFTDAVAAYERAIALNGESVKRLAGFVEASILAEEGRIPPPARSALERMLKLDPASPQAQFWLASAKEQDGDLAGAAADYQKLLASAPKDADWRSAVEERIAAIREASGEAAPAPAQTGKAADGKAKADPPSGPSAADIAAAERLSPADRQKMIEDMVASLSSRLDKDGHDLAGWQRLIRSLAVMGRKEEAVAALAKARKTFAAEPEPLAALTTLARDLGLGS